jgi:hypothetical protein
MNLERGWAAEAESPKIPTSQCMYHLIGLIKIKVRLASIVQRHSIAVKRLRVQPRQEGLCNLPKVPQRCSGRVPAGDDRDGIVLLMARHK